VQRAADQPASAQLACVEARLGRAGIAAYGAAESSPCAIFATSAGFSSLGATARHVPATASRSTRSAGCHGQLAQPPRLIGADRSEHHPAGSRIFADEQQGLTLARRALQRGTERAGSRLRCARRRPFGRAGPRRHELARLGRSAAPAPPAARGQLLATVDWPHPDRRGRPRRGAHATAAPRRAKPVSSGVQPARLLLRVGEPHFDGHFRLLHAWLAASSRMRRRICHTQLLEPLLLIRIEQRRELLVEGHTELAQGLHLLHAAELGVRLQRTELLELGCRIGTICFFCSSVSLSSERELVGQRRQRDGGDLAAPARSRSWRSRTRCCAPA